MLVALAAAPAAPAAPAARADTPAKTPAEKKAPPPAREELGKAEMEKTEKFFDELYHAVVKHQDACPKMATAISAVFDKHQAWLKKIVESGKDLPPASKEKLQKKQKELETGIFKCKEEPAVQAAMKRFLTLATKKQDAPPAKK